MCRVEVAVVFCGKESCSRVHDQTRHDRVSGPCKVVVVDWRGTRTFSEEGDPLGVPTEGFYGVTNPLDAEALVKEADVLLLL
jgi:hypothetical protein